MPNREEMLGAVRAVSESLRALEEIAISQDAQMTVLVGQGQSTSKAHGDIMAKLGEILQRLDSYLDDANRQGARINQLERDVRGLRHAGE